MVIRHIVKLFCQGMYLAKSGSPHVKMHVLPLIFSTCLTTLASGHVDYSL